MISEFAPRIRERAIRQSEAIADWRQQEVVEDWPAIDGAYTHYLCDVIVAHHPVEVVERPYGEEEKLEGFEVFAYDTVKKLLGAGKDRERPVVALDLGGGEGRTWGRLARAFEQEVQEGRLAFVVTDLRASADEPMANYVVDSFPRIRKNNITLPNGEQLQLGGNVDFLSEKLSLSAWSKIPEIDIPQAARLLSPEGVYVVNKLGIPINTTGSDREEYHNCSQGVRIAWKRLEEKFGLVKVEHVEAGAHAGQPLENHVVFRAPNAPLIGVN